LNGHTAKWMLAALALVVDFVPAIGAAAVPEPIDRPAIAVKRLEQATFLGVAAAGDRLVAVGERGLIALSDDKGGTWRQAKVPVSVSLTAVAFPTSMFGWAVGHYGVVLHSSDGGETWIKQLDGIKVAQIVADGVPTGDSSRRAERLVEEGPDKPFLDLFFPTQEEGFVVGAYGLMLRTTDGGKTWRSLTLDLPNPKASHLYAIRATGGALYVAGEQGLALRSDDAGVSFKQLVMPYGGSWFTLVADPVGAVVFAGLQGKAYSSVDRGATWQSVELPVPATVTVAVRAPDGRVFMATQGGQIVAYDAIKHRTVSLPLPPLPMPTGLWVATDGGLVATTLHGVQRLQLAPENANRR